MGTRNLTCVVLDGEYKVAQYCQWDGYLKGMGKNIAEFFHNNKNNLDSFKQAIRNCSFISEEEIQKLWQSVGADGSGLVGMDISDKFKKKYPELHRDISGSELFENIIKHNGGRLNDALDFAGDSIFCEWAYVVDLDHNTLEIYKGSNSQKLEKDERFHFLERNINPQDSRIGNKSFYPVRFLTAFPLYMVTAEDMINLAESMEEDRGNAVNFMTTM
jgi:hypothetical protein